MKLKKIAALLSIAGLAAPAFATNGMNLEGYGAVSTSMGGTSAAYDNGNAGMINNPATLGLNLKNDESKFELGVGLLAPQVSTGAAGAGSKDSAGTAYYMPAVGYVRRDGAVTWGLGVMSQGGMGTEFGTQSFMNTALQANTGLGGAGGTMAAGVITRGNAVGNAAGLQSRSELGIGRVLLPLTYAASDNFVIGGSFDYVWGGLDLSATFDGNAFSQMLTNSAGSTGTGCMQRNKNAVGVACGSFITGFGNFVNTAGGPTAMQPVTGVNYGNFNFDKGSDKFSQALTTTGWGGNVGFTWQASPALSVGAVYHAKTKLNDMSGRGNLTMSAIAGGGEFKGTFQGEYKVVNFQWPETFSVGLSYKSSDKLQIALDYKQINWSDVMQNFHMVFRPTSVDNANFASLLGTRLDAYVNQNWRNQNVVQVGMAYKLDSAWTLRAGASVANTPIPSGSASGMVAPWFPAISENHYTGGFGYAFDKLSGVDVSVAVSPKANGQHLLGFNTSMSQVNWQASYNTRF